MNQIVKGTKLLSTLFSRMVNRVEISPALCVACLAPHALAGLCTSCLADLPLNTRPCIQCALPIAALTTGMHCAECQIDPPDFQSAYAPWRYQYPVDCLIRRYKYHQQYAFGRPLIHGFIQHLDRQGCFELPGRPDLIVPSPMHPKKRRKRGFNQAEDIAEQVSRHSGIPWSVNTLHRKHMTTAQSGLGRQQRLANLNNAYRITGEAPARVAIIDDVITTGATARAMASALHQAGVEGIEIWALARTPAASTRY